MPKKKSMPKFKRVRRAESTEEKKGPVKAKVREGADVLECVPKSKLKELDIFSTGCLLHFTSGNWGGKNPLADSEYSDLPRDIVRGFKYLIDRTPIREIGMISRYGWRAVAKRSLHFRSVKGMRYVPKQNILEVSDRLEKYEAQYWARVRQFIEEEYDDLCYDMARMHPKYYDPFAYPTKASLWSKYHWTVEFVILTVPDKGVGVLTAEQYRAQVKREEQRIRQFYNDALLEVSAKFLELTVKLRDKLVNKEVFRESTLTNLSEFINAFDALNVTGNRDLGRLVKQCNKYLEGVTADTLRDSDTFAAKIGKQMDGIVEQFSGLHDGALLRAIDI